MRALLTSESETVIRTVGVVVPAADEQARIGACLDALAGTLRHLRRHDTAPPEVRVVVVLDSCTDGTATVVAEHPAVETVVCGARSVGAARALGVRHLLDTCAAPRGELWLANTDADSRVPGAWLTGMLTHARRGAHLVLGTVSPDDQLPARQRRAWLARHQLHAGHTHVHGANFGIRADTYLELGGWPPLRSGEDVALARHASTAPSLRITRTASIPVTTSSRLSGRAPSGFAEYLSALGADVMADAPAMPGGSAPR